MKLRNLASLSVLGMGAMLAGACSSTTNNIVNGPDGGGAADGGGATDGGDGASTTDAPSTGPLSFKPSNIDLTGWDLSKVGDVTLSGTNCIVDSEGGEGMVMMLCDATAANNALHKIVTLPDQTRLSVFVVKSLRVEASTVLQINRGHLPVVLVSLGAMELLGSIDVGPGTTGGAFNSAADAKGVGPGGGTAGDSTGLAGGGASYCGLGGKAGTNTGAGGTAPSAPTVAYGSPALVPLLPGSAGGSGALANANGSGGGALQLVAGTSFALHASGTINVGGGGGAYGGLGKDGAGGGGSGGALLIESPTVTIDGKLAANGGGGGQGNGDLGENGHPDAVAQGGHKTGASGPGGNGSFDTTTNGLDGPSSADVGISAASGGGGAGRIRINSNAGKTTVTGAISPAQTTPCVSRGALVQ